MLTGRYAKRLHVGFEEFVNTLPDTVRCVEVKGKFIYWKLDRHVTFSTLGMTGNYKITPNKYARVAFILTTTLLFIIVINVILVHSNF